MVSACMHSARHGLLYVVRQVTCDAPLKGSPESSKLLLAGSSTWISSFAIDFRKWSSDGSSGRVCVLRFCAKRRALQRGLTDFQRCLFIQGGMDTQFNSSMQGSRTAA